MIIDKVINTNIMILDLLLGGGIHSSDTIQLVGDQSSGKTIISLQIANKICIQKLKVLYIDTESRINEQLLTKMGLTQYMGKYFYYDRAFEFEEIDNKLSNYIDKIDDLSLIIIDSLGGLSNDCFLDKKSKVKITTSNSAYDSIPLGRLVKKYKSICSQRNIPLMVINQHRNKIISSGTLTTRLGPKIIDYSSNVIIRINSTIAIKEHPLNKSF